ncbi:polysaccharide deacetylase family protein [Virgibacillus oceani]
MRQLLFILFYTTALAISACDNSPEIEDNDQASDQVNQETEEQTNENAEETQREEDKAETEEGKEREEGKVNTETVTEPVYTVADSWSIVPIDDANEEVVLLTIDDAPDGHALQMAETLHELDANAIFFVNGHFLNTPEDEDILKEIHNMGFYIGNHTYNHPFLPDIPEEEQTEEIVILSDRIEEIIGERPRFFRAPNGANTDHVIEVVEEEDMTLMNWSYGYDWEEEYMSSEAIADIMVHTELLGNGANLLMHDREWTAGALGEIVNGLRDQGYEIVDPALIE